MVLGHEDDERLTFHHTVFEVVIRFRAQEGDVHPTAEERLGQVRRIVTGNRDLDICQLIPQHVHRLW